MVNRHNTEVPMRIRLLPLLLSVILVFTLFSGCKKQEDQPSEPLTFKATVLEVYEGGSILVEPLAEETAILASADRLTLSAENAVLPEGVAALSVGDTVSIAFDGMIAESYPAQLMGVYSVEFLSPGPIQPRGEDGEALGELPGGYGCEMPLIFKGEAELVEAAKAGGSDPAIVGLESYYKPKSIPEGIFLEEVGVRPYYVALDYSQGYLFEWYRTLGPGDTKQNMDRSYAGYKQQGRYYIVEYDTLQEVFWEQDGLGFHAQTPCGLSETALSAFCDAVHVPIEMPVE